MKGINQLITLPMLCLLISIDSGVFSQSIQVGIIDYYGTKLPNTDIKSCLPFRENDTIRFFTDSISYVKAKNLIVDCLLTKPQIKQADIIFICCDAIEGKWMAFIGVSDKAKSNSNNKNTNSQIKDLKLPKEITNTYDSLEDLRLEGIQSGQAGDDHTEGHSLLEYPPSRKLQEKFRTYAEIYLKLLQNVIRNSKYPYQRAVASTVIAYCHDKKEIINNLLEGAKDNNGLVRNNAIRAIGINLEYSQKQPNLNIKVSPDLFITLMNSLSWSDRNKSAGILMTMSMQRDPKFLAQLKKNVLESLVDMAKWKSEGHAMAAYMILGRMGGWTEKEIFESSKNDRSKMVDKMLIQIK